MNIEWVIEDEDIVKVKELYEEYHTNPFVEMRISRNNHTTYPAITKPIFWRQLIACLLTTQQRSGPNSGVGRLLRSPTTLLDYEACHSSDNLKELVIGTLSEYGLRRANKISEEVETNILNLTDELWSSIIEVIEELGENRTILNERKLAILIKSSFKGIGPKQSRNLIQSLGLTLYEIPLDSRICKWLNENILSIQLSPTALSDENYYTFIEDGIHLLCREADILPSTLDACIFASFDGDAWTEENVIW